MDEHINWKKFKIIVPVVLTYEACSFVIVLAALLHNSPTTNDKIK